MRTADAEAATCQAMARAISAAERASDDKRGQRLSAGRSREAPRIVGRDGRSPARGPASSCATTRPVRGPATSPTWPWPKASTTSARGAGGAEAGQPVRHGGAVAHPDLHPLRRQVARQVGEAAQQVVAQDLRPLPVRRGLQPRDLHLAGAAQAAPRQVIDILPSEGISGVRGPAPRGRRASWRGSRARSPAARGAGGGGERPRMGAGARSRRGRPRSRPPRSARRCSRPPSMRKPVARACAQRRALAPRPAHQRRDIGAGVEAMPAFLHQHAEAVAAVELRLALAHLVGVELDPFDADVCARTRQAIASASNSRAVVVDVHQAAALGSARRTPASRGQRRVQRRRVRQHRRAAHARCAAPSPRSSRPAGSAPARAPPSGSRTSGSPAARAGPPGSSGTFFHSPGTAGGMTDIGLSQQPLP